MVCDAISRIAVILFCAGFGRNSTWNRPLPCPSSEVAVTVWEEIGRVSFGWSLHSNTNANGRNGFIVYTCLCCAVSGTGSALHLFIERVFLWV